MDQVLMRRNSYIRDFRWNNEEEYFEKCCFCFIIHNITLVFYDQIYAGVFCGSNVGGDSHVSGIL